MDINVSFRRMLTDIAQLITENDLKAMKYNCLDFIPKRRQEEIESAFDLWEALEERDKLSADNTQFLRYLLEISTESRTDVLKILEEYERNGSRNQINTVSVTPTERTYATVTPANADAIPSDLTKEFIFLLQNIGRQWKDLARSLGLTENDIECIMEEHPRSLREQARKSLKMWVEKYSGKANKITLIHGLQDCGLNELSEIIQSGKY